MNWEQLGKISYQLGLLIIEWGLKICALVSGILALSAKGSFTGKLSTGFGSLSSALRQIFEFIGSFDKMSWVVREYYQLGQQAFQEAYGLEPINQLVGSLNGLFGFVHQISINISHEPISSLTAGLIVSGAFYLLGRVIQFARQKGRRSWICRLEQQLGNQVFNRSMAYQKGRPKKRKQGKVKQSIGASSPNIT